MNKRRLPSVTVALCAYNEAANIAALLRSVIAQEQKDYVLKKILVVSDGSTDATISEIKKIKSPLIEVWNFKNRAGKSSRLNMIYQSINTDYLVQTDADVIFADPYVILHMIQPLIKHKNVVLCGGNSTPLPGVTFIEKAINATVFAYQALRHAVRDANNIFSADGRLLSMRKIFVERLTIPSTTIANDAYAFFLCKTLGMEYQFVAKAVVYFRSPQTLKDHIQQNTRFLAVPKRMSIYFDSELIKNEYDIPFHLRLTLYFKQWLRYPIHSTIIFLINKYCFIKAQIIERKLNAKWNIASSTKILN